MRRCKVTKQFLFETELGEILSAEVSIICCSADFIGAYFDELTLQTEDSLRLVPLSELSAADRARLDRKCNEIADDNAIEAYQEFLESAADSYRDGKY